MGHPIEHAVGIYIGLLLLACLVAIISKHVSHLPYTIFLTLMGLLIGLLNVGPKIAETGFGHELIFFVKYQNYPGKGLAAVDIKF